MDHFTDAPNLQRYALYMQDYGGPIGFRLATRHPERITALRLLFELPATKEAYLHGESDPSLVSPDAWRYAQWSMDRPGNKDIQFALQANYWSNLLLYDQWHDYFRRYQAPMLVTSGKGDAVFAVEGASAYLRDFPKAEIHILSAGHFALENACRTIAAYIRNFLGGRLSRGRPQMNAVRAE